MVTIKTKVTKEEKKKFNEKNILELIDDDFTYVIKERGKEYYNDGNILNCYKSNDTYYAKVEGSADEPYNVTLEYNKDTGFSYDCDCPYSYPCKHEYAVAVAIQNKEYDEKTLKPNIPEKKYKIKDIIKDIPAEELKKYIISKKFDKTYIFDTYEFESKFCNYFPKQGFDYYYNKLYNQLTLSSNSEYLKSEYLISVEKYINSKDYESAFVIIKAIINAYSETELLDEIVDSFPKIGMFLRVVYRKSNKALKDKINALIKEIEKADYYNNVYLEDVILTIK